MQVRPQRVPALELVAPEPVSVPQCWPPRGGAPPLAPGPGRYAGLSHETRYLQPSTRFHHATRGCGLVMQSVPGSAGRAAHTGCHVNLPSRRSRSGRVGRLLLTGRFRLRTRTPQLVDHPIQVQTLAAPVGREGVGVDGDAVSFEPRPQRRQRPTRPLRRRRRVRQRTAVRPNEGHVSGRIQGDPEPLLVNRPVVPPAKEDEIVERRRPAVGPVPDVVNIDADASSSTRLCRAAARRSASAGRRGRAPPARARGPRPARGRCASPATRRTTCSRPSRFSRRTAG